MIRRWVLAAMMCGGCSDDSKSDPAPTDTTQTDTSKPDTTETIETTQTETRDTAVDSGDVVENPWGFPIRVPGTKEVACDGGPFSGPWDAPEADWLCTFDDGTTTGTIYTQATPTECVVTLSRQPVYGIGHGWIAREGQSLGELTDVVYDWGGNHHNDSIELTFGDKRYRYYHSSFGFGFRTCQPMDCLQIRDSGGTVLTDGCTKDRTLPIVCRPIEADGTWDELVDTYAKCNGDPNR